MLNFKQTRDILRVHNLYTSAPSLYVNLDTTSSNIAFQRCTKALSKAWNSAVELTGTTSNVLFQLSFLHLPIGEVYRNKLLTMLF